MTKRYAIVRVDNSCPAMLDDFGCIVARNMLHCKYGEDTKNYGDTKVQLVLKVAQVLFKRKLKAYKKLLGGMPKDKKGLKEVEKRCLDCAKEIVEFLGVK